MKKILLLITAIMLFSPLCYADDDDYGQRGNGWRHHEREYHNRQYYQPKGRYYQQPSVGYYQQPAVNYYQQPPVRYYQQPPVIYQQQPVYSQPVQYPSNGLRLNW